MKKTATLILGLFAILLLGFGQNHPITTKDSFFYLNGKKFFVKGVGLEIVKPGQANESEASHNPAQFRYDIQRILGADYNTIRLWGIQTKEQLEAVKDLDIKIIMGIWIPNHTDYSAPNFIDSSLQVVKNFLSYSKNYDNIIAYVIMNEPTPEEIMKDFSTTELLWKTIVDEIHSQHPGTPVGMSAYPPISFANMDVFDFTGYNVHPGSGMQETCFNYAGYINYLKEVHGNKPFIDTEYGVSVSPLADNTRFNGNTQEERQTTGLLSMYRGLIDGGAGGGCTFINADGWYKGGDEQTHGNDPEESYGMIEYKSVTDMIGTPRPAWYAIEKYNSAVVTSPKNGEVYQNKVPVEIFGSDTIDHFKIAENGTELLAKTISDKYFLDTISLTTTGTHDLQLDFTFYDKANNIVKEESIISLTSDTKIVLPKLKVTSPQKFLKGVASDTIKYEFVNNPLFKTTGIIKCSSDPVVEYEYDKASFQQTFTPTSNYTFSKSFGTHFDPNVNFSSWMNRDVVVFAACTDISFGKFSKRISGYTTIWQDTSYVQMPARIKSIDYRHMLGVYPFVPVDKTDWYIGSIDPTDWLEYYINVPAKNSFMFNINYSSVAEITLTVKVGDSNYDILLPATGGEQIWKNKSIAMQPAMGKHRLFLTTDVSGLNINWFELTPETSLFTQKYESQISVYPNPVTNNTFVISLPNTPTPNQEFKVKLIDISGIECFSKSIENNETNRLNIDLSECKTQLKGVYLLQIMNNGEVISKKIVVN